MSATAAPAARAPSAAFFSETVLDVRHWTDRLFSFRCTRDPAFRFAAGQFAMIGLMVDGKPLLRAYSMGSAPWQEELEFLSIKVPDGPLTSRLQNIVPGDQVLIGRKPVGTLLLDNLRPGRTLWLFCTGTGLAPFLSLMREPEAYDRFERVVIQHTVRDVAELAFRDMIEGLPEHEVLGELVAGKLVYLPSVTRQPFVRQGRAPALIESNRLTDELGLPALSPAEDRVMLCGSEAFNADMKTLLEGRGFTEGSNHAPGEYVLEKAFVEK
ncbi:ferredoxin--NADP reductase [Muricoccus radiodurans]|uniref:ferredoxin--NADP reductase n=1 Tax=Muricoccus radiodurans TaxID=2231721 RepID=UPI003CF46EF2